jgi:hypothetical protein
MALSALQRRRMTKTAESTWGGGRNARRGNNRPGRSSHRPTGEVGRPDPCPGDPAANRCTAARCSTRSAATRYEWRASSVRSRALDSAYGGLATTRNGRRGQRKSWASASTTMASGQRWRSARARAGCSSTASTRAPASRRCRVSVPVPAPMSTTSSPGRIAVSATMRAAHSSTRGCQPQLRRDPGRALPGPEGTEAGTPHHHHEHVHTVKLGSQARQFNRFSWLPRFAWLPWAPRAQVARRTSYVACRTSHVACRASDI